MLLFVLVVDLHWTTSFISVLISYTFISLDCLAEELEICSVLKTMIYRWMPSATLLKLTCYR